MADRLDRRSSQRTTDGPGDGDHEYFDFFSSESAFESFPVADGYRPSSISHNAVASSSSPQRANSQRSVGLQTDPTSFPDSSKGSKKRKKQSMSKNLASLASRNSFSLRHDAQYSDAPRRIASVSSTSEMTEAPSARPLSAASRLSIQRHQSTFVGASNPSHPYEMYPQNTSLNRQSTTSSYHPSSNRSFNDSQGPTHPYGMYPQATDNENETDPLQSSADIASVGFPGLGQPFARRLGPDGEEADDIIGPDGHTEQLPPYTRYPAGRDAEPLPPKQRSAPTTLAGARTSHLSVDEPQTAHSATSMTAPLLPNQAPLDGTSASLASDNVPLDSSRGEKLASRSRKRTCFGHLPVWAVVLMVTLLVIVAALLGALIGHFFPSHNHGNNQKFNPNVSMPPPAAVSMLTTTLYDAAPLHTTATNLPPAPTGAFALVMGAPDETSSSCLGQAQDQAWQCATGIVLDMSVSNPQWDAAQISIWSSNASMMGHNTIKAFPPSLYGQSARASLMNDTNSPQNGPALFFVEQFDKMVVLPYQALPQNSSAPAKRSLPSLPEMLFELVGRGNQGSNQGSDQGSGQGQGQGQDQDQGQGQDQQSPEDMIWFCYWNGTILEGFIYLDLDASATSNDTAEADSLATTAAPAATPPPDQKRDNHHHHHHFYDEDKGGGNNWPSNLPPFYPKIVKLQERRDPQRHGPAYCQLMEWQNGTFVAPPGKPTIVNLTETDLQTNEEAVFDPNRRRSLETREPALQGRQSAPDFCHCQWISQ